MAAKTSWALMYAIFTSCATAAIGASAIKKINNFFNMIPIL
jgi:hypothetical protein